MTFNIELDTEKIRSHIGGNLVGSEVLTVKEVDSTNELAKQYFQNDAPEGMVFLAECQTKGKGRSGRTWHSPPGVGVFLSVLLRPVIPAKHIPQLTLMAGVAVAMAVNKISPIPVSLKWPNDILLNGRKLGGILCELVSGQDGWGVVIGIGVNVNHQRDQFPEDLRDLATSLLLENGHATDRTLMAISILERLDEGYQDYLQGGTEPLTKNWTQLTDMFGKPVCLTLGKQSISGTALGLDEQGRLIVCMENGQKRAFSSGEVTLHRE